MTNIYTIITYCKAIGGIRQDLSLSVCVKCILGCCDTLFLREFSVGVNEHSINKSVTHILKALVSTLNSTIYRKVHFTENKAKIQNGPG